MLSCDHPKFISFEIKFRKFHKLGKIRTIESNEIYLLILMKEHFAKIDLASGKVFYYPSLYLSKKEVIVES